MGSPHYKVNEKHRTELIALKSFGNTNEDIAKYLEISVDTLNRFYQKELDTAQIKINGEVAAKLYKKATKDEDMTAIIFWLKTRARWRSEDSKILSESNDDLKAELKALRDKLDAQNKREY